jgi:hypothetical protein
MLPSPDPRGLITGKWTDIGKTKGRFAIGLTSAQMSDLVELLSAL